jgi:glycosyltransferase involved in cell wall biosynthesis
MRVLIAARHRYPAQRDDATGPSPRPLASNAPGHMQDLLARGLAELGHEVHYLLRSGADAPLPAEVHATRSLRVDVDVFHDVEVPGRPWVSTVHAHRPPCVYFARYRGGELLPPAAPDATTPYRLPPGAVCVSRALARALGGTRWVHNGIDPGDYVFSETKGGYLLFMAAMQGPAMADLHRRKGLDVALGAASDAGAELVVAGTAREAAVTAQVAHMCRRAGARYVGDVRGARRAELLAGARALLFPTRMVEGFGLVMAEALMSGTPVIASDSGACPELIDPDVGFVCRDREAVRRAIEDADAIEPAACRRKAVRDFHYRQMAAGYVREYERELGRSPA